MQPDQGTLMGQAAVGIVVLLVGGFIVYKVIQAIAAFVDALQGARDQPIEDENQNEDEQK